MAMGTVAAELIIFIAVMIVLSGLVAFFNFYISDTKGAMVDQRRFITDQLQTEIDIPVVYFNDNDPAADDMWVYVKNIGDTTLNTVGCVDLYVDNQYITLTASDITYAPNQTTIAKWGPDVTIKLNTTTQVSLASGRLVDVVVHTCKGVSDTYTLST